MEAIKEPKTTSLVIEVKSGTNDAGADTFRKKSYSNVKVDAPVSNVLIVAKSIAAVLSSSTRYFMLNEVSIINEA
jgi:hypothetical protein